MDPSKFESLHDLTKNLSSFKRDQCSEVLDDGMDIEDPMANTLNESQLFQLKNQIMAYKYLIRNLPIPTDIEQNILHLNKDQWDIERENIFLKSMKYYNDKVEKSDEMKNLIQERIIKRNSENSSQFADNILNEHVLALTSEKTKYFFEKRLNEIGILLKSTVFSNEAKVNLEIEKLLIENRDFYMQTREKILSNFKKVKREGRILELELLDRNFFRREKPNRRTETRMVERIESQMKSEQEQRKKARHKEFINALLIHQYEFLEFHKKKYRTAKKKVIHSKNYVEWTEKRKDGLHNQKDKEVKVRVKALKDNDFDAYIGLVQETKNTRILELLKKTDDFLKKIGAKVKIQKGSNKDDNGDDELREEDEDENHDGNLKYLKNSNKIYYNLAHSIKEDIKEQPTLIEGGTLKSYQVTGLQWLVSLFNNKLNGILADEMGLGKTIQTIALFCYLLEVKKVFGPFLVVVPLTTLPNWIMELDKWAPSIKKIVYKGSPMNRKMLAHQLKTSKWNVCITTYEYILKDRLILNKHEWKYIVVDEGHRMKNSRSKFAQTLGQQYNSESRLLLTGTPLQNNLGELWSLLNFLLPKVFSSCDDFEKWFSMPLAKISGEKDAQLSEEEKLLIITRLHQVLRPFLLRRVKKDVESEIPEKVEFILKIELSAWQRLMYQQIENNGLLSIDPVTGKFGNKALMNLVMQLRKICNHPYLFLPDFEMTRGISDEIWRASGKFEVLDKILPKLFAFKHRVLIFSQMTHLMDILEYYFFYKKFKYLRLDGNTKADDRGERMAMFNEPNSEYDIFLLSTRAGGLGLNLQSADTVILFDSDWNPQMDLQAQDRAHRIGQKSEVRVFRFITNTIIEEEILSKASFKMNLDAIFIQAGLYNQKSTDMERRVKLEDLLKKKNIIEELDDEIPNDEQINEMVARNEEELQFFDQMDKQRYDTEKEIYKNFRRPDPGDMKYHNYRLLSEFEVPDWIRNPPREEDDSREYGKGNRIRKQVNYQDEYENNDMLLMIEEYESENKKKQRKKVKAAENEEWDDLDEDILKRIKMDEDDQREGEEEIFMGD